MCQNGKPHSHDDFMDSRMEIEVNAWFFGQYFQWFI